MEENQINGSDYSRRAFIKTSAAISAATMLASLGTNFAHAAGSDVIRVGAIGCGGRGRGAIRDCVEPNENVVLTAIGDVFPDRLNEARQDLASLGERCKVSDDACFSGFDAFEKVIASDVDVVILATPPGFRPTHLKAAVAAGKHVFMEKPVAVDAPGVRMVIESSELARQKGLGIVAGTQRRHQRDYLETIRRIHDGAIGDVVGGSCYWNQGGLWMHPRQPQWSDMEWQLRNWLYFTWLSGDHIVEQHVHNIDVMNWVIGDHPTSAYGMGGRQARTDPAYGHVYDHFAIEYVYPRGARVLSMCRQIDGTDTRVGEHVVGAKGTADPAGTIRGENPWRYRASEDERSPYQQEHIDLIESIRAGKPLNEGKQIAESTLCAIMGRMSAYTGKEVTWEQALNSQQNLMPEKLEMGALPVAAVPIPGKEQPL